MRIMVIKAPKMFRGLLKKVFGIRGRNDVAAPGRRRLALHSV